MSNKDIIILGCSSQQPTRRRNHGAYLVRWNREGLLFDPGEGTQRQFIFAEIAPPTVTRIFVSHFHGDHCLGLGSMLMRLNLDKVEHPIHCYYPASGKKNFDCLRYGCIYHETIQVIEHPVQKNGVVHDDGKFKIEACFLQHGVDNVGWRVTEADRVKFDKQKLAQLGIKGPDVRKLSEEGKLILPDGLEVKLDEVSHLRQGDSMAVTIDTVNCPEALEIASGATVLLCESTYTERHKHLAKRYLHMTAKEAALLAQKAGVRLLILTHFSARYNDLLEFKEEAEAIFPNTVIAEDFKRIDFPV